MSIFNTSYSIKFRELYEIDDRNCVLAYVAGFDSYDLMSVQDRKQYTNCEEIYELCGVTNPEYKFFEYTTQRDLIVEVTMEKFIDEVLKGFGDCEVGSLIDISRQLREVCSIPEVSIDIVHDFERALRTYQPITTLGSKHHHIALTFPTKHFSGKYFQYSWALAYVHKWDAPRRFYAIAFPLIPKEGCIDVFSAR